jgi:hypothetical protein
MEAGNISQSVRGRVNMPYLQHRRWNDRISLGQYRIVFQAEVYAIMACVVENLDKNYRNRNIYILSYSSYNYIS